MDLKACERILEEAFENNQRQISEHRTYDFLDAAGFLKTPQRVLLRTADASLKANPFGSEVFLKVQHPEILHKTEIGGVRKVSTEDFRDQLEDMFTIRGDLEGILACEAVEYEQGFGKEILLGMQNTREFGPVITFGLGGIHTELFAQSMKPNQATSTFSPLSLERYSAPSKSFSSFGNLAVQSLLGKLRGMEALVSEKEILDLLNDFSKLVTHFSSLNSKARFHLDEFELNPLVISDGAFIALDALLKFREAAETETARPIEKISHLLNAKSACVVGVSSKTINPARQILRNLLEGSLTVKDLFIVKEGEREIDGVSCVSSLSELPKPVDLLVVAARAEHVPNLIQEAIDSKATNSILLIAGGLGEKKGGETLEEEIRKNLWKARENDGDGPVMVGGNSLGIVSRPGGINTLFIPESRLPLNPDHILGKHTAILSQSGAFAITRMNRLASFVPQYLVSTGNQVDLGVADFLMALNRDKNIHTFACYIEGFQPQEGLRFMQAAKQACEIGKDVVVYKAGRSKEGQNAVRGHTAAIAGQWDVTRDLLRQSGCLFAETFEEFTDLLMLSALLHGKKIGGRKLGAISNAGFETVGMSDHLGTLELGAISEKTRTRLRDILGKHRLSDLQDIRNPMDLTPMASDQAHAEVLQTIVQEQEVDAVLHGLVPLTPALKTRAGNSTKDAGFEDEDSFVSRVTTIFQGTTKPLAIVVDAGKIYDPMADAVLEKGIPVFRSADRAIRALSAYIRHRLRLET